MTDLEIMQRAKMYIDKLANGINPIDDFTLTDNDKYRFVICSKNKW